VQAIKLSGSHKSQEGHHPWRPSKSLCIVIHLCIIAACISCIHCAFQMFEVFIIHYSSVLVCVHMFVHYKQILNLRNLKKISHKSYIQRDEKLKEATEIDICKERNIRWQKPIFE
jgi:amino acid permease